MHRIFNLKNCCYVRNVLEKQDQIQLEAKAFLTLIFCLQKKVLNLLPLLNHLAFQIILASLAATVYQMEKITLAYVPRVGEDPIASVSPNSNLFILDH